MLGRFTTPEDVIRNAPALERYADRLVEGALCGTEWSEVEEDADAIYDLLEQHDPPHRAVFERFTTLEGDTHAKITLYSKGGRTLHCWDTLNLFGPSSEQAHLTAEQLRKLHRHLEEVRRGYRHVKRELLLERL